MIEFVDELPGTPRNPRQSAVHEFAQALRGNPGRWAKWPTHINESTAQQYASAIRRRTGHAAFQGDDFEAEYRDGSLYVRYPGGCA